MTPTTTQPAFDASVYDLPIPMVDGLKADKIAIVISGRIELDRTNPQHLDMIEGINLGAEVKLECEALCVGKPTSYRPDDEGPGSVSYSVALRVVEAQIK